MGKFRVNDIIIVTDGEFKGQIFSVKSIELGASLEYITCVGVNSNYGNRKFFFDDLCAEVFVRDKALPTDYNTLKNILA